MQVVAAPNTPVTPAEIASGGGFSVFAPAMAYQVRLPVYLQPFFFYPFSRSTHSFFSTVRASCFRAHILIALPTPFL